MIAQASEADLLILQALVTLNATDLLYADQYLCRAEVLLPTVCTREQYLALQHDQGNLPRLTKELRQAAEHGDWAKVSSLAQEAAQTRERLVANEQLLQAADAVYGPRVIHADATALGLTGVVVHPTANLLAARDATLDQLRFLLAHDSEWAPFYSKRIAHFEHLQVITDENPGATVDPIELQKRLLQAVGKADFVQVQRLAETIATQGQGRVGRLRAPRLADGRAEGLAAAFSDTTPSRARELGLTPETLVVNKGLNEYLSCCCADRATFPESVLTETHRKAESCTCGHACPPNVHGSLRDNLDLLLLHPFISSVGARYLPWFGVETLLVENFSETEPDARTGLLSALGLHRRRGLPRIAIEDALLTNGSRVCTELGLDPAEFTVACIPFDAYLRLAPQYQWGQQQLWTHFDGYQVSREVHLRALVGGDARYGGPDDLCSIERDYDVEHLTVRFAVLRRQRFMTRETPES
jgi:hypothetical protein